MALGQNARAPRLGVVLQEQGEGVRVNSRRSASDVGFVKAVRAYAAIFLSHNGYRVFMMAAVEKPMFIAQQLPAHFFLSGNHLRLNLLFFGGSSIIIAAIIVVAQHTIDGNSLLGKASEQGDERLKFRGVGVLQIADKANHVGPLRQNGVNIAC